MDIHAGYARVLATDLVQVVGVPVTMLDLSPYRGCPSHCKDVPVAEDEKLTAGAMMCRRFIDVL